MLTVAQQDFFLTEVLFFHEPPESPIEGASDIGQVSMATIVHILRYFYLLKIYMKYFPFFTKEKYSKIQNKRFPQRNSYMNQ